MSNFIVIDGDKLLFVPAFDINTVIPTGNCVISGSGEASIENKKICILGDEKKVSIEATYTSATFPTAGKGTLTITSLTADQVVAFATATTPVIAVGGQFDALFSVSVPAMNGSASDPVKAVPGKGAFINSQAFVSAG